MPLMEKFEALYIWNAMIMNNLKKKVEECLSLYHLKNHGMYIRTFTCMHVQLVMSSDSL